MFTKELHKYQQSGKFSLTKADNLVEVCNAPSGCAGVYLLYSLKNINPELIYIGRSGKIKSNGSLFIRKGGMKDRLVNGKQFGQPRRHSWRQQMMTESIDSIRVHRYVTSDEKNLDCPKNVEGNLLKLHQQHFGILPRWNCKLESVY